MLFLLQITPTDSTHKVKSPSSLSTLQRFASIKNRRSFFVKHRSLSTSFRSKFRSKNDNLASSPQNHLTVARASTVPQRRPNSFREVAKHFVPASLQRSTSLTQEKEKRPCQSRLASPLASATKEKTISNRFDDSEMGRRISNTCIPRTNGAVDEESNPASVESFVRKCADYFGE